MSESPYRAGNFREITRRINGGYNGLAPTTAAR
jgi:predicted chitinase